MGVNMIQKRKVVRDCETHTAFWVTKVLGSRTLSWVANHGELLRIYDSKNIESVLFEFSVFQEDFQESTRYGEKL